MADEPAQPLLEGEDGEGDLVLAERVAASRADGVDAGRRDRIAGRGERQLVDDHATERLADDVDALPEARRGEQHRMRRLARSEEHTSELQSLRHLVCRLLLEK